MTQMKEAENFALAMCRKDEEIKSLEAWRDSLIEELKKLYFKDKPYTFGTLFGVPFESYYKFLDSIHRNGTAAGQEVLAKVAELEAALEGRTVSCVCGRKDNPQSMDYKHTYPEDR